MIGLRFKILDDPDKRIVSMKRGMRNRILRKAVRAGARPVQQAAKGGAPRLTGALASSISVRIAMSRATGAIYAVIGPRRRYVFKRKGKVQSEGAPSKIAHLVEGGTRPHSLLSAGRLAERAALAAEVAKHGGSGEVRGARHPGARANPFLLRAWQSEAMAAVERMRQVIADELKRIDAGES